ncbi:MULTISPECIES: hypothetical protein [unclassified Knoellia]|uniref:hypothetical protein n=1 Tax=Knoellia altitudinis TaxID=3404795 RepID=UPI00361839DB
MPTSLQANRPPTATDPAGRSTELAHLYFVRTLFALVWAGLLTLTASPLTVATGAVLVIYPLFDAVAAVIDARSSRTPAARTPLFANLAFSLVAAVAVAVAATSGIPAVLRVWGIWAIAAGLVQLVVALRRRQLGGQWPMILSGGLSAVAGSAFILQASGSGASLSSLAGYATLGAVFFLVSAIRLTRRTITVDA